MQRFSYGKIFLLIFLSSIVTKYARANFQQKCIQHVNYDYPSRTRTSCTPGKHFPDYFGNNCMKCCIAKQIEKGETHQFQGIQTESDTCYCLEDAKGDLAPASVTTCLFMAGLAEESVIYSNASPELEVEPRGEISLTYSVSVFAGTYGYWVVPIAMSSTENYFYPDLVIYRINYASSSTKWSNLDNYVTTQAAYRRHYFRAGEVISRRRYAQSFIANHNTKNKVLEFDVVYHMTCSEVEKHYASWVVVMNGNIYVAQYGIKRGTLPAGAKGELEVGIFASNPTFDTERIPGFTAFFDNMRVKSVGYDMIRNLTITVRFPAVCRTYSPAEIQEVKDRESVMAPYTNTPPPLPEWKAIEFTNDQANNAIHAKFSRFDPTYDWINPLPRCHITRDDVTENLVKNRTFNYQFDMSYCPYKTCNVTHPYVMQSVKLNKTILPPSRVNMAGRKKLRLKFVNSGRCIAYTLDPKLDAYPSSKCTHEFLYDDFSNLKIDSVHTMAEHWHDVIVTTGAPIYFAYVDANGYLNYKRVAQAKLSKVVLEKENLTDIGLYYSEHQSNGFQPGDVTGDTESTLSRVKVLPVYDYSKVDLKSIMYTDTSRGKTLFVCNPRGDLGSRSNCFFSIDEGSSWSALSSLITNVKLYKPESDTIYTTCNRAKRYCTMNMQKMMVLPTSSGEYNTVSIAVSTVSTYSFDTDELTYMNVQETSIDPSIGTNTHGVFTGGTGQWKKVFIWQN